MSDNPPPAGELVDDFIAFLKSVHPNIWMRYCERAHTITNEDGPKGLSKEEAGKRLLSVRRLELTQRWEVNLRTEGKGANYLYALGELKDPENEIANCAVDALKSGAWVIQGYDPKLDKKRNAPQVLITAKTVLEALDANSDSIELKDGGKLFDARLVRAEPLQVPPPAPDLSQNETTAAAPLKSEVDAVIQELLLTEYENALAAKEPTPPSAKDAGRIVAPHVKARGYPNVSANRVQALAEGEQYKTLRRGRGRHRMSEDEIEAAKKKLAELKAAMAAGSS
jgi:hypothetical protein